MVVRCQRASRRHGVPRRARVALVALLPVALSSAACLRLGLGPGDRPEGGSADGGDLDADGEDADRAADAEPERNRGRTPLGTQ